MDGTGPGPMWINFQPGMPGWGEPTVACAPNPWANQVARTVVLHGGTSWGPAQAMGAVLSDADIECIAQRVAKILREGKP